jgi:hypothetical protein
MEDRNSRRATLQDESFVDQSCGGSHGDRNMRGELIRLRVSLCKPKNGYQLSLLTCAMLLVGFIVTWPSQCAMSERSSIARTQRLREEAFPNQL